jgi:DNA polymerase-3 subunit alpha
LRDAISQIETLIDRAIELGHEVIAFTEHESVSNAIKIEKYYNKIKKDHPDFKVIRGNEIYLCRDGLNAENFVSGEDRYWHFILLAKNARGHEQIRELSTRAWNRSYSARGMTRVPTYYSDLIEIIGQDRGNVIGSTACLGGWLPQAILSYLETKDQAIYSRITDWCSSMMHLFGEGNFYLEMQPSRNQEQVEVNKFLLKLSGFLEVPYIITTDSHYVKREDARIHKAFLNSQDGEREVESFYATTYLMNTAEIESYFDYFTEVQLNTAYKNIRKIKDSCEDYSLLKPLRIPSLDWKIPETTTIEEEWYKRIPNLRTFANSSFDGDNILARAVVDKLKKDPRLQNKETYDELNSNLETTWKSSEVNNAHWSAYFLNLQKTIEECWNAGTLVGPGRGSGVGFALLYVLDIIQINPLWEETKCYSWRFLNPERVSVLDIDSDIEGGKRAQVLQHLRDFYGQDRVANVVTFGTEKSKSAIQTACRGLGIDSDIGLYLASLIPADRGQTRTLKECFYGDEEKGFKPIPTFVNAMKHDYPEVWEVAQKIEGLVCRTGEHAGGVIFVDEPFTKSTALMKVPNGDVVTQFDLHDDEAVSLIKIDLLSVECLDKIHTCLDLLVQYGKVSAEPTLKETYEKAIGIYNLERNNSKMWDMVNTHQIHSLFQMEQQSGIQGISAIHPKNINDLTVLNSVIRLMSPEKGGEQPLQTWARYRRDISQWYKEMRQHGLTQEEMDWLANSDAATDGIVESQEGLMLLVQEDKLGGNSLTFADKCRKGIAKKQGKVFEECEKEFFENVREKGCSEKLAHYVWDVLLKMQRGYSFNRSHCLAYSLIALQEMNLCYKFPIIYWNCACLITDSGGESGSTDYAKLAQALGKMISSGINVEPPDINYSDYNFSPREEENKILYGLSAMSNVSSLVPNIIEKRPYKNIIEFVSKVNPNKQAMISLIKGGAFDNLYSSRQEAMVEYIWITCDKKKRLTLQNMPGLIRYNLVPEEEPYVLARRIYEFNRYLKAECKSSMYPNDYKLDCRAMDFLNELEISFDGDIIGIKAWDKIYQGYMDIFREWISENKTELLDELNTTIFMQDWGKYAKGNLSSWEMDSLSFYYHEHELAKVDKKRYGISDFETLPEVPVVDKVFKRGDMSIPIYRLSVICGTCIAKDKGKSTIYLLTNSGVVTIRFSKEYFSLFDKQISKVNEDGSKTVIEKSFFNKGNKLLIQGYRRDSQFVPKKYKSSTLEHQLYHIDEINEDGSLVLRSERAKGESEEDV